MPWRAGAWVSGHQVGTGAVADFGGLRTSLVLTLAPVQRRHGAWKRNPPTCRW